MKKIYYLLIVTILFLSSLTLSFAVDPVTIIVDQPDAPLKLSNYSAQYSSFRSSTSRPGIRHQPSFENVSGRTIVAFRIGFVSFNYFNEFIGKFGGLSDDPLPPDAKKPVQSGLWNQKDYGDFAFMTGVAYVEKVRFDDGEVWTADMDDVFRELEKIEAGFEMSQLVETRQPQD